MLTIDTIPLYVNFRFRFAILDCKGIPMVSIQDLKSKIQNRSLLILFMHPVAAAAATVFFKLKPVRRVLFIFCRHVIPLFALGALQNYVISRHIISFVARRSLFVALASATNHEQPTMNYLYSTTSDTVPAPTVRPPSRMAKRKPFSIAIGAISSISIWMLSPGITISTPAGRCATPVTSVVLK